jgi:hypothetical protein
VVDEPGIPRWGDLWRWWMSVASPVRVIFSSSR